MTYYSGEDEKVLGKDWRVIKGSFAPAGTGAPTDATGIGYTVARASAGVYTVTLLEPFVGFVCFGAPSLRMATGEADVHQVAIGDVSASGGTFDIEHLSSDATDTTHPVAADVAADAANVVSFEVTVALNDITGSGL